MGPSGPSPGFGTTGGPPLTRPWWKRVPALAFVLSYVVATAWFAACQIVGDPGSHPVGYFFTWDMFPFYYSESFRRIAVGETESGEIRQLIPGGLLQYRAGVHGDLTRVELERGGRFFRAAAEQTRRLAPAARGSDDPIVRVFLYDEYWPVKFNYPPELYAEVFGSRRPQRRYWRLREQYDVASHAEDDAAEGTP